MNPRSGLRARLPRRDSTAYQVIVFVLVGGLQVVLDTAVFILLGLVGVPVVPANVAGRLAGASMGFMLNGRITFASAEGTGLDRAALARFVLVWSLLTALGSALLYAVGHGFGLVGTWFAKPLVEAGLALLSFAALKFFVFRRRAD